MKSLFRSTAALMAAASVLTGLTACGPNLPLNRNVGLNPALNGRVGAFNNGRVGAFNARKKWTIAIHLAADNNLYSAGLDDLNEIEAGLGKNPAAAEMFDVIVLFDGLPNGDSKIYRMKPEPGPVNTTVISEVIDDKGAVIPASKEVDSGSPETLNRFMDFVTKNFPAQHNSFSIWNHGDGIFGRLGASAENPEFGGASMFDTVVGGDPNVRGSNSKSFASDDHGGHLSLKDLNPALEIANKNLGKAMDIFGFDTCLMQYIETAYQLKGQANILVASEELEPGDGWDYDAYIATVAKNPDINPVQLAHAMVETYGASYRPGGSQRGRDVTLAALDVNAVVTKMVPALNAFGAELQASLPANKAAIDAARNKTQTFYNRDSADLGNFLANLGSNSPAAQGLQQAMKETLINETHYGASVDRATGFQVYFPRASMSFNRRYDDPALLRFAETQGWSNFLKAFTSK